jgi:integrase
VETLHRKLGRIVPWLFPNLRGTRIAVSGGRRTVLGARIGDFRRAWATACWKAGGPGLLVHDLRRSGVRNMVRADIPEHVAMTISGHKTRAVFDRYHIVSPGDLQDVARRLMGTIPGTAPR